MFLLVVDAPNESENVALILARTVAYKDKYFKQFTAKSFITEVHSSYLTEINQFSWHFSSFFIIKFPSSFTFKFPFTSQHVTS